MIMNVKNFLVAGFVGGIVDWLLGWLFYGIIFKSIYGGAEDGSDMNMLMVTLGCLSVGFLMSYVFVRWAGLTNAVSGLKAGAVFGLLLGFTQVFFGNEKIFDICYQTMAITLLIYIVMGAFVGATIAFVNGKMK
jgi:hypothetical protein